MYSDNDIQEMIDNLLNDKCLRDEFNEELEIMSPSDRVAIRDVLSDGYVERFDRYDSDVCEQFISIYESVTEREEEMEM